MFDWKYWLAEFEARVPRLVIEPVPADSSLSDEEKVRIRDSISTFQLGEQSEGRTLLRFAEQFALRRNIPELPRVTELFIREEQHHAAQLREFMLSQQLPLKKRNWTDSIFRHVRRLAGFEAAVTILVTAEMIGFVYYRALARATQNVHLRTICRQMCADEAIHLRYEAQLLRTLRGERVAWRRALIGRAHRAFVGITARIVFREHRAVLEFAGHDAASFRRDCLALYRTVIAGTGARYGVKAQRGAGLPEVP
jgi:hypothetical protein